MDSGTTVLSLFFSFSILTLRLTLRMTPNVAPQIRMALPPLEIIGKVCPDTGKKPTLMAIWK